MITVFTTHCYFLKENPNTQDFYDKYFKYSGIGVEFFIILSGFFSSYTYKVSTYKDYMTKKIKRIIPVHWLCLIIGMYLSGLQHITSGISTPLSFFGLNTLFPIYDCSTPAPWMISTLLVLYAITPYLANQLNKIDKKILLPLAYLLAVMSSTINYIWYDPQHSTMFWFLYVSPYFRIVTFMIGMLLGVFYKSYRLVEGKITLKHSLLELLFFFIIAIFIAKYHKGAGYWYTVPIVILISISVKGAGVCSYILKNRILVQLSKYSFSFYMIHFPILSMVGFLVINLNINISSTLYLIFLLSFFFLFWIIYSSILFC